MFEFASIHYLYGLFSRGSLWEQRPIPLSKKRGTSRSWAHCKANSLFLSHHTFLGWWVFQWHSIKESPIQLMLVLSCPHKAFTLGHLILLEELSKSDVAWSSLIWTVLVFNCLRKTDGCRVTYGSISQTYGEKLGARQMLGWGDRRVRQVVHWAGGWGRWTCKNAMWPVVPLGKNNER